MKSRLTLLLLCVVLTAGATTHDYEKQLNEAYAQGDSGHFEKSIELLLPLLDEVPEDSFTVRGEVLST